MQKSKLENNEIHYLDVIDAQGWMTGDTVAS